MTVLLKPLQYSPFGITIRHSMINYTINGFNYKRQSKKICYLGFACIWLHFNGTRFYFVIMRIWYKLYCEYILFFVCFSNIHIMSLECEPVLC